MNVYEEAHRLAQAIRESEEYKEFQAAQEILDRKPELKQMIEDFQRKQMEKGAYQQMGQGISPDMMRDAQEFYQIIMRDPEAAQYLQSTMRFSLMMSDVYKILGDTIGVGNMLNL